jgi:nucleoside-diphosphate-sugar epimerase
MKIAVLGANGFIGKVICKHFESRGYVVHALTRSNIDLTDFTAVSNWLKTVQPDSVVNCATAMNTDVHDVVYSDVQNNLAIFLNFYNNSQYFKKFINVGSGAEFDRSTSIESAVETDILTVQPKDSYGFSKNLISRLVLEHDKFYTLRLFGCFHCTVPNRLFKRVVDGEQVNLTDRQFDYFSAQDFCTVLEHYVNNQVEYKDINCVYQEKLYLSQILSKIGSVAIIDQDPLHYTGNGDRLASLNLPLLGLEESIKENK